jgi:PAS domain S-box-containing protein
VGKTLDGIVTSWNEAAERMFGYSAGEMIGQSIRRLFPAERQAEEDMIRWPTSNWPTGSSWRSWPD